MWEIYTDVSLTIVSPSLGGADGIDMFSVFMEDKNILSEGVCASAYIQNKGENENLSIVNDYFLFFRKVFDVARVKLSAFNL